MFRLLEVCRQVHDAGDSEVGGRKNCRGIGGHHHKLIQATNNSTCTEPRVWDIVRERSDNETESCPYQNTSLRANGEDSAFTSRLYAVTVGTRLRFLLSILPFDIPLHVNIQPHGRTITLNMTTPSRRATESEAGGGKSPAGDIGKLRRLDRAITQPGAVKINVEGAFIVDEEANVKNDIGEGIQYEHKDIRLPHHNAVVSHVAVDVSKI
jgi:hypothetical protein